MTHLDSKEMSLSSFKRMKLTYQSHWMGSSGQNRQFCGCLHGGALSGQLHKRRFMQNSLIAHVQLVYTFPVLFGHVILLWTIFLEVTDQRCDCSICTSSSEISFPLFCRPSSQRRRFSSCSLEEDHLPSKWES